MQVRVVVPVPAVGLAADPAVVHRRVVGSQDRLPVPFGGAGDLRRLVAQADPQVVIGRIAEPLPEELVLIGRIGNRQVTAVGLGPVLGLDPAARGQLDVRVAAEGVEVPALVIDAAADQLLVTSNEKVLIRFSLERGSPSHFESKYGANSSLLVFASVHRANSSIRPAKRE